MVLIGLSLLSAGLAFANAASPTQVTDFGRNPTNAEMYIYVLDNLPAHPVLILGMHYCDGTGPEFYNDTRWADIADTKGFTQTLTHAGGGDSQSIANMVKYTIDRYDADKSKVFMAGRLSWSMVTTGWQPHISTPSPPDLHTLVSPQDVPQA
ncbi:hypothetical protein ACLOAV_003255 [Pseudogymnoascus australis]